MVRYDADDAVERDEVETVLRDAVATEVRGVVYLVDEYAVPPLRRFTGPATLVRLVG